MEAIIRIPTVEYGYVEFTSHGTATEIAEAHMEMLSAIEAGFLAKKESKEAREKAETATGAQLDYI